ncbi:hypothetical protein CAI21_02285 [Alkalilimnicola ehrlichii]|uniref:Phasin domain-containing protein n=1 Tax=Alkalilimnicola ehrlichii TaxID=351052 RepID=A0A3E0X0W6_9GAMM|nr:phasin family protein [Alkalilimnicola ehrlichii]RFA31458.1 hypothetical protein CAI21_02285 [Alkalilimnicola ehrlichii]RFA39271.1 hypothetical protein CAL65_00105 [Alkalilimnicola ehrlichii]
MYQVPFSPYQTSIKQFLQPAEHLNKVWLEQVGEMTKRQFASARDYAELGWDQVRRATEVRDPESFQSYLRQQNKTAKTLSRRFNEDAKSLLALGEQIAIELEKLAKESMSHWSQAKG